MEEEKDPHGQEVEQETKEETEEFSFLQETIKEKAGGRRILRQDVFRISVLGFIFGIIASLSFSAFKPWFEQRFQSDPKKVTIPREEEDDEQDSEEDAGDPAKQLLDEESYRQISQSVNAIAQEAGRSVVELTGVSENGWLDTAYDDKNSVSGLIIADNGQQLLILGKTDITKDANEVTATFSDGRTYPASLKKRDANLGLGVYAVVRGEIQDGTWAQLKIAVLGSSNAVIKGDPAIVLGKPFGYAGGVGYGAVASSKNILDVADGRYSLISTDVAASREGSGFIVNLEGEVTGVVNQKISAKDSMNLITAYGISDLKNLIELLSNGDAVPYVGIKGIDVTEEIAAQGIPKGVYVKEVEVDSPAMASGIQNGDIITSIAGVDIASFARYHSALMEKRSGQKIKIKGQRKGTGNYVDIDFNITVGSKE